VSTLYEEDFYSWTQAQAAVLRRAAELRLNAPGDADWEHLAEEIEDMGISLERELYSRYRVLLLHLLKWRYQPAMRSSGWEGSIRVQRHEIARLLRKNPGLKPKRPGELEDAYEAARLAAAPETGLAGDIFPTMCPFTLEEVEHADFWPEAAVMVERS
jgi:ribosomal protein L29